VSASANPDSWGTPDRPLDLVARNVGTRYLSIFIDGAIGLILLPFTVSQLGASAYGLWALTTSVTALFGVLDLGYSSALGKFVAQYRAWRDRTALNEVLSTMGVAFAGIGVFAFAVTALVAWRIDALFNLGPEQVTVAQQVLLTVGAYVSIRFPLSVFGAVVYGFQRFYVNEVVSIASSVVIALVTVGVLSAGYGLVSLVAATTLVRMLTVGAFVANAYRVFPGLQVRPSLFRGARLREVTGFSVYMLVLDWSTKLNYSAGAVVIGAMIDTGAVAVWTVGQRLAQIAQQLTNQLNDALFPAVVDSDAAQRDERLALILVQGTKLSLALAAPLCLGLIIVAEPLITSWVGAQFATAVRPTQILLAVVLVRVTAASANLILRGAGRHRLLAYTNGITAVISVVLAVVLVQPFGLSAVALSTLIPVSVSAALIVYPAACRRVGIPMRRFLADAIVPALWPAIGVTAVSWVWGYPEPRGLFQIALQLAAGALAYAVLFVRFAMPAAERRFYWTKLRAIGARHRGPAAAAT
jgi:O-antigen/teichoic acid export membrane protein